MINQLEIFRFMAFCMIFCWHSKSMFSCDVRLCDGAALAVSFFFTLSGFLSSYRHQRDGESLRFSVYDSFRYVYGKIAKFYPLYLFVLLVGLIIREGGLLRFVMVGDLDSLGASVVPYVEALTFTHSWSFAHRGSFGALWFLSTLMSLYLLRLPLLILVDKIKVRKQLLWVSLLLVFGVIGLVSFLTYHAGVDVEYWLYTFPPSRVPEYLGGMLMGVICASHDGEDAKCVVRRGWSLIELFVLIMWVAFPYLPLPKPTWDFRIARWIVPNLIVITIFALQKGVVSEFLKKPFFIVLGALSMPCYLLHGSVIAICNRFVNLFSHGGYLPVAVCFSATLLLSAFFAHDRWGKGKVSFPVKVAWLMTLIVLIIPCGIKVFASAINQERLGICFSEYEFIKKTDVYYTTDTNPRFSERTHISNVKMHKGAFEIGLTRGVKEIRVDIYQTHKNGDTVVPRITKCAFGRIAIDPATLRPQNNDKFHFKSFLIKIKR